MEHLKIQLVEWEHKYNNGCCHSWGVDVYINGKKMDFDVFDADYSLLSSVLEHLGISHDIEVFYEEEFK